VSFYLRLSFKEQQRLSKKLETSSLDDLLEVAPDCIPCQLPEQESKFALERLQQFRAKLSAADKEIFDTLILAGGRHLPVEEAARLKKKSGCTTFPFLSVVVCFREYAIPHYTRLD
jgi:hypothetical protein